jgi:predicted acylesterase/phospholipase RssA
VKKSLLLLHIVVLTYLVAAGCDFMKTPFALEQLNGTVGSKDTPPRPKDKERIATIVREQLTDAYFYPSEVAKWLDALGANPDPLRECITCLNKSAYDKIGNPSDCQANLLRVVAPSSGTSPWGLPVNRPTKLDGKSADSQHEIDAQRFIANVRGLAATLSTMVGAVARKDLNPIDGVQEGALLVKNYLLNRKWHRREANQPNTALVLSGGAANGAFTAGAIWRLLSIIDGCKKKGECKDFNIDLVAGTSTGSLIGVLADIFFTPGQEQRALDLLVDRYTCSVESQLYCAVNEWDWRLVEDVKGLVRFDGVEKLLDENLTDGTVANNTELVVVSVKLEDGMVFAQSDQDPIDLSKGKQQHIDRVQAVLASIIEPVLAEPVRRIGPRPEHQGTFVDGGVRSVLPILEAVNRGAERVLAFSNSTWEPAPTQSPKHVLGVMMSTLDVLISSGITEPQLASLRALVRRWQEYQVCQERLAEWEFGDGSTNADAPSTTGSIPPGVTQDSANGSSPGEPKAKSAKARATTKKLASASDMPAPPSEMPPEGLPGYKGVSDMPSSDVEDFCRRDFGTSGHVGLEARQANWSIAPNFPQVETSFAAEWFNIPESDLGRSVGYAFDPTVMRPLFLKGLELFQQRCLSSMKFLGLNDTTVQNECKRDVASVLKDLKLKPVAECNRGVGELRICDE